MEVKKGNGQTIAVIILTFLVISLGAFIAYDKYFKEDVETQVSEGNVQPKEDQNVRSIDIEVSEAKKYISGTMDSKVIDITPTISEDILKTDFKKMDASKSGVKIVLNCKSFTNEPGQYVGCDTYSTEINDSFGYNTTSPNVDAGCSYDNKILRYGKFIISLQHDSCTQNVIMRVYYDNIQRMVYYSDRVWEDYGSVTIKDDYLYFIEADENSTDFVIGTGNLRLRSLSLNSIPEDGNVDIATMGYFKGTHGSVN